MNFIAHIPNEKAVKNPNIAGPGLAEIYDCIFSSFIKVAPIMTGIDNINENLTDSYLFIPMRSPPAIVAPDLLTPGMIAIACRKPIAIQSKKVVCLRFLNDVDFLNSA